MECLDEKYKELRSFIHEKGGNGVVIAFSGGVDSSTLVAVSHDILKEKAVAVTAVSETYPFEEVKVAKRVAQEIGIKHILIETDELSNADFVRNPEDRCYYCKRELLSHLESIAEKLEFKTIFEGTNFSDLSGHRPGFKAVLEKENVYSPWIENQFTKAEIRALAKKICLSVYDKPSLACLASRIPFGTRLTADGLNRIGKAEQIMRKITGVQQIRIRDQNNLARIEVERNEMKLFLDKKIMSEIAGRLKRLGFKYVTLDLEGYRTGSMLETL